MVNEAPIVLVNDDVIILLEANMTLNYTSNDNFEDPENYQMTLEYGECPHLMDGLFPDFAVVSIDGYS